MRWLAGIALVWGLAMTLWLPWLDHAKSYRGVVTDMARADAYARRPAGACVASRNLTEPQRAMFHYIAGLVTVRRPDADCPLLLVHTSEAKAPEPGAPWRLAWQGTRPGDAKEWFWLFARF